MPTTPQQAAGSRMEPPVSEPMAPSKKPAAPPAAGAEAPRKEPRAPPRGGAARRAARHMPRQPRVVDVAVMRVVAEGTHRELGHVELAQADGAGVEKPPRR